VGPGEKRIKKSDGRDKVKSQKKTKKSTRGRKKTKGVEGRERSRTFGEEEGSSWGRPSQYEDPEQTEVDMWEDIGLRNTMKPNFGNW